MGDSNSFSLPPGRFAKEVRTMRSPALQDLPGKEGKGEGPFGPPHVGTGRPSALGVPHFARHLSDIDIPTWRNCASLRVRYFSLKRMRRRPFALSSGAEWGARVIVASKELAMGVNQLSRLYGDKPAVDRVSFDVKRSEVFGFLGPNGAGKTTTIKMLTTLLQPSSGRADVLGHDLRTEGRKIRERIGVVQQQDGFDQGLNVETSLDIYGLIWDVPRTERKTRIEEVIARFGMQEFRKMPTVDLSAGQRRRVQVAREFIHDMDLLFLDEPTVGLDPIVRRALLDYLKERV